MQGPARPLEQASCGTQAPPDFTLGEQSAGPLQIAGGRLQCREREGECCLKGILDPPSCCNVGAVGEPSSRNCNLGMGECGDPGTVFSVKASGSGSGVGRQAGSRLWSLEALL